MSEKIDQIVELLNTLTVLEASQLSKRLQDEWGVSAAAPMAVAMPGMAAAGGGDGAAAAAAEEPTEFDVILKEIGPQKLQVIKVVRELTGLGLKEAKDLVDGAPKPVKEDLSQEEANDIKTKLEAVGAKVELKGK